MTKRYYDQPRECIDWFREEYHFLSNFYPAKLTYGGIAYDNSEAAYQAQKLAEPEERRRFEHLYSDEAKDLGQEVEARPDWDDVKLGAMEGVLLAKFTQNPRLAKMLVGTGDTPLFEGNTWGDTFWGVDRDTHEGENHLGKLLMGLRERFQRDGVPDASDCRPARWFGPIGGVTVTDEHIVDLDVECIVNPAEASLMGDDGIDGTIHRMAGPQLREECAALGGCAIGQAKITDGYALRARRVIHTVCPVYTKDDEGLLAECYRNCLDLAREDGLREIAFPVLSLGKCCFPRGKAVRTAVGAIRGWFADNDDYGMRVVLSCTDDRVFEAAREEVLGG